MQALQYSSRYGGRTKGPDLLAGSLEYIGSDRLRVLLAVFVISEHVSSDYVACATSPTSQYCTCCTVSERDPAAFLQSRDGQSP